MKIRWTVAAALVLLTACGSKDSNATVASTVSSTSTTSTVPLEEQPFPVNETDGEVVYEEPIAPIDSATKALLRTVPIEPHPEDPSSCQGAPGTCSGGWSVVGPGGDCGECEGSDLYQRQGKKWELIGSCHNFLPMSCSPQPPQSVTCSIRYTDRDLDALFITGCNASRDDLREAITEPCTWWSRSTPYDAPYWRRHCIYGPDVQIFQQKLLSLGYQTNVDGYFGVMTARAVLQYQSDKGLKLTARFDDPTQKSVFGN